MTPLFRLEPDARRRLALEHRGDQVDVDVRPMRGATAAADYDRIITGRLIAVPHAPTLGGAGTDLVVLRVRNGAGELVDVAYSLAQVADIRPAAKADR